MHPVYEPREDSFFLAKTLKEYARGRVLDMGTGTGYQALTAAGLKQVTKVIAVDLNPDAIKYAIERNSHPKITYFESDLFSQVTGNFDTILFNAPYLPDDEEIADMALDGGPTGLEVVSEFVIQARHRLNEDGVILVVLSNHTDLNFFARFCNENGFIARPIKHLKLDFETLFIYALQLQ